MSSVCLDQDQNDCDCSDPNCTYGDCLSGGSVAVTAGATMSTVNPNPSINNSIGSAGGISQLASVFGQWGATIAGIATGQPTVVTAGGARTGVAAVSPSQSIAMGGSSMILLLIAAVVVVIIVADK